MTTQGYHWMNERVPETLLNKTYQWLRHVGLGSALTETDFREAAYWVSEKQRNTEAVRHIGTHDTATGASYVRPMDPSTLAHEFYHGKTEAMFNRVLARKRGLAKKLSEPLSFLLQTAAFGGEASARQLLGQSQMPRSVYSPDHDRLGNLLIRGYYVVGRNIFPIIDGIVNSDKPERYILELQEKVRAGAAGVRDMDPAAYFSDTFGMPRSAAKYVTEKAGFRSAQEAALSLADMKIEAIDAQRAIASRLFIAGGQGMEEAEASAGLVVSTGASRPILQGLDTLAENVAAMYEFGFSEQDMQEVIKGGLTRPGFTVHMKDGMKEMLATAGDMPRVSMEYFTRYINDAGFREYISTYSGGKTLRNIKESLGAPITQETIEHFLRLPITVRLDYNLRVDPLTVQHTLSNYPPEEEMVLWKNLPPILSVSMLQVGLNSSSNDLRDFTRAVTDDAQDYSFKNPFSRDRLIEYVHEKAKSMQGDFETNVKAVAAEVFEKARSWLENRGKSI